MVLHVNGVLMKRDKVEQEALSLPPEERARLAQKLLLSLDSQQAQSAEDAWLTEAVNRARDIDSGTVTPIDADEVRKRARALLR